MNVLLLTPVPHLLGDTIVKAGDRYVVCVDPPQGWPEGADFIVSFGYRHIIREPHLSLYRDRMVNIHISLLPWNRGADPNFWSWFDRTPKGITIHAIEDGIDTGPIIVRCVTEFPMKDETLRSSYKGLMAGVSNVFAYSWPTIRELDYPTEEQVGIGTYHKIGERDQWWGKLPLGWDTPVKDVEELGSASRGN